MTKGRLRRLTLLAWVWCFASFMVWSLATPLWTSPDAPAHDLMAYHAVRDLSIEKTDVFANGVTSNAITDVPKGLKDSSDSSGCYAFMIGPADCLVAPTDDMTLVPYVNPAGRNLPTYYLATGWPSLLVPVTLAVWADRVAAAALASLFVALAFGAVMTRTRRSVAVTGLAMAVTPMTMYLGGSVNPNTLEITTGLAIAACSVVFLQDGPESWLGRAMYRNTMIAAAVMVSIRMLAPVWVLAWVVAFALLATRRHWAYVFSRRGLPWFCLPVVGALFDVGWTITSGITEFQAQPRFAYSFVTNLGLSKDQIDSITLGQQIGIFGWLDTPMPNGVYIQVLMVVMFLAFTSVLRLTMRQALVVVWLSVAQYVIPVVLQAVQYNTNGPVWQGRYTLPLTVMVPIFLMMYAAPRWRATPDRMLVWHVAWTYPLAVIVLASAHFRGLVVELRRNASGLNGPTVLSGVWQPPLGALTLLIVQAVLLLVFVVLVLKLYARDYAVLDRAAVGLQNPWRGALDRVRRLVRRLVGPRAPEPPSPAPGRASVRQGN